MCGYGRAARLPVKAALMLTAVFYAWAAAAVFIGDFYDCRPALLAASALAALALTAAARLLFLRFEPILIRRSRLVTAGFLFVMGVVQLSMISPLRYTPIFDIDALFGGAAEWADTGSFASYYEYFGMFRNNCGGLLLLRCVFGIARLVGVTDYFAAASVFNSALSLFAMYLTGSVCKELMGERGRMTAYLVFLISPPFYFIAPAFYTDALTMVFPVLILRLYLAAGKADAPVKRLGLYALMGLAAGVGYSVKATAAIMPIAVFIDSLLHGDMKKLLSMAAASLAMVLLCTLLINAAVYRHLDRLEAERNRIPIVHWVMMGMNGVGFYSGEEYDFTKSFEDPEERRTAVKERLFTRLKAYDASDFIKLFTAKLEIDFGDGTYGLSDCLGCPHGEDNALHSFLLNGGENREVYKHICTGVVIAMYLLLIASCLIDVFRGDMIEAAFAPRLALLGLLLFLLIWEARWRYFSNHIPIFIVSTVYGLERIGKLFRKGEY